MNESIKLIRTGTGFICSECGTAYSNFEYETYYSKYSLNCKMCGAVFGKEKPFKQLSFFEIKGE